MQQRVGYVSSDKDANTKMHLLIGEHVAVNWNETDTRRLSLDIFYIYAVADLWLSINLNLCMISLN